MIYNIFVAHLVYIPNEYYVVKKNSSRAHI